MKNNKKILAVLLTSAITSLSVNAQIPASQPNKVAISTPVSVGQGNTYEKEVTPLLRDISKKKSLLELRKLDRELEKLEEETLTAQIERDKALNPPVPVNVTPGGPNFGQALPSMGPVMPANSAVKSPVPDSPETRVLMVYGFDNDLYAKVSYGKQGGYIVKKGDILPDGRLVTNVNSNFIEVQKAKKSTGKNEKLFVMGPVPVITGGGSGNPLPVIATGSGANAIPVGPASPLLMPPNISNPVNIPNGMGQQLPMPVRK